MIASQRGSPRPRIFTRSTRETSGATPSAKKTAITTHWRVVRVWRTIRARRTATAIIAREMIATLATARAWILEASIRSLFDSEEAFPVRVTMRAMGPAGRLLIGLVLGSLSAAVAPAAASAEITEFGLDGGVLELKASDARDAIEVAAGRKSVVVSDRDGIPESEAPCKGGGTEITVSCPREQVKKVVVDLGDGDDSFDGDGKLRFEVEGDSGDDEIDGGDAADLLEGKYGDDRLDGSDGPDELLGGLDDDVLFGKAGKDLIDGGPGDDRGDGGGGKDKCAGIEHAGKGDCA